MLRPAALTWVVALLCTFSGPGTLRAQETVAVRGTITENGRPVAARLYIHGPDGDWHHARADAPDAPPAVNYDKQRSDRVVEIHTALPAAPFVADLPPGKYELTVERGKEYLPRTLTVTVDRDQKQQTLPPIEIRRWTHMAEQGWYSGDTHVHRPVAELPVPVLADDVNLAFPLTYWVTDSEVAPVDGPKSSPEPVSPEPIVLDPRHLIYPLNTEYELFTYGGKRHTLGAVFVIGHKQPFELTAPPAAPIAAEARRQGALLDLDKHTWPWSPMIVPVMQVDLFELANNHIWRTNFLFRDWTIDTLPDDWDIETDAEGGWTERGWIDFGFQTYYAFLNCGFNIRPTGGTATGVHPVPLGFGRVYVHIDGDLTYDKWLAALSAGRSFVTTGPMLTVTVDGQLPGARLDRPADAPATCRIQGTASAWSPLDRIEILVNGDVVKSITPANRQSPTGGYVTDIDETVTLDTSGWIAVRCFQPRDGGRFFYAHTGPAHVRIPDRPLRPKRKQVRYLLGRVEQEIARNRDLLTAEELAEFEQAREIYQTLLQRAE